jgi:hypothetical protein
MGHRRFVELSPLEMSALCMTLAQIKKAPLFLVTTMLLVCTYITTFVVTTYWQRVFLYDGATKGIYDMALITGFARPLFNISPSHHMYTPEHMSKLCYRLDGKIESLDITTFKLALINNGATLFAAESSLSKPVLIS